MKVNIFKSSINRLKAKLPEDEWRRMFTLLAIQIPLIPLLLGTSIFIGIVNTASRQALYLTITAGSMVLILIALRYSLAGRYRVSAWLTIVTVMLGPWGPIIFDKSIINGDFVPLIFLVLPIQICSLLLSNKATLAIAIFQTLSLVVLILSSPNLIKINWPSLLVYIIIVSALSIVSSITTRKQMEELQKRKEQLIENEIHLRDLSTRDSLTGLFNRRYMDNVLEISLQENQSIAIIMTDVDNFKKINDVFGHALGDSVLSKIADIFKRHSQNVDVICRYGGDEFILILPNCSLIEGTKRAKALRKIIENTALNFGEEDVGNVTLSFGVSSFPDNGLSSKKILAAADKALFIAKKEGRNCVVSTVDKIYSCCAD